MARSAKIYDFTIPAGGSFTLLVEGSFYRIQQATGALEVRRDGGSGIGPIYPGQGERDEEFKRLTLIDKSGSANAGFIVVSDGSFVDDRITGEVSVINGEKSRTLAGAMYIGNASAFAVGAQYSHCQLWNPTTNKNLIVGALNFSTSTAQAVGLGFNAVQLNTDQTGNLVMNKKQGGAATAAQVRAGNYVGSIVPVNGFQGYMPANLITNFQPQGVIVVPPGTGLTAWAQTPNTALITGFEWFEESIL